MKPPWNFHKNLIMIYPRLLWMLCSWLTHSGARVSGKIHTEQISEPCARLALCVINGPSQGKLHPCYYICWVQVTSAVVDLECWVQVKAVTSMDCGLLVPGINIVIATFTFCSFFFTLYPPLPFCCFQLLCGLAKKCQLKLFGFRFKELLLGD